MLRAIMTRLGKVEFAEVPKPGFGAEDVLLRIRRIGICGSDVHVYHGKHPYTSYPVVQGHEFCGEVAEVGRSVPRFKPGDLVTALPQIVCGKCLPCREGSYHICENLKVIGFQAPGVAQEFFPFPEPDLLKLPAGFTPEVGALVEPTAVAVHAVSRAGNVSELRADSLEIGLAEVFGPDRADVAFECVGLAEMLVAARMGPLWRGQLGPRRQGSMAVYRGTTTRTLISQSSFAVK